MTARLGSEYRYFGKLVLVPFRYFSIDIYRNIDIFDNTNIYIYTYTQNVFFLIKPHLKHSFNAFLFLISDSKIRFSLLIIIILINHNIALLSYLCFKKTKMQITNNKTNTIQHGVSNSSHHSPAEFSSKYTSNNM